MRQASVRVKAAKLLEAKRQQDLAQRLADWAAAGAIEELLATVNRRGSAANSESSITRATDRAKSLRARAVEFPEEPIESHGPPKASQANLFKEGRSPNR